MARRLTAYRDAAASISRGSGSGVVKGAGSLFPNRPESSARDAVAAKPIVNRRRERIIHVPLLVAYVPTTGGIFATRRDGRQWLSPDKMNETII
jgi:hypothetical protein